MITKDLTDLKICVKGAGEMASGVAWHLYSANLKKIVMLEVEQPLAVRRQVCFSEAVHDREQAVEGIKAIKAETVEQVIQAWENDVIAVRVDPEWRMLNEMMFDVVIDAILAKKNLGTRIEEAPLVIGIGPGFIAGQDVHHVMETNRGHNLGRVIHQGSAEPNTGIPGKVGPYAIERVFRAPDAGIWRSEKKIGDSIAAEEEVGYVESQRVFSHISGIIRGLIRDGTPVNKGAKLGDVDPRGEKKYCDTISDKARTLGGAVLRVILSTYNR